MRKRVIGAPPPRAHAVPTYRVLRPQRDGELYLAVLADTVLGIDTHYVLSDVSGQGSTQVCRQHEPGGCAVHDEKDEWSGWIQVYDFARRTASILRLAPKEYDAITAVLGLDLRWAGRRVKIKPVNLGRGRQIEVTEELHGPAVGLGPFDMTRTICLVFGIDRIPRQTPHVEVEGEVPS